MIDSKRLLSDLERLLASLEKDLRERATTQESVDEHLREEFRRAKAASRTGESLETWRDELLTQVGVAWILGTVFVRFLEDNELVELPRLSGTGERRKLALDQQTLYFQKHPTETDREYVLDVFRSVRTLPAAADLFDEKHNPLWMVGLSGDGATELLRFWQRVNPDTGTTDHDFTDPLWNTRFLGDLYQDLSEAARKKYALLQTPEFVEEFILDRALTPAIETFGYKEVKLIDPACGSGHFLLGAFRRLVELRLRNEPGVNTRELVRRTITQLYGVDVNPFAIAIARFRLLLAALQACDEQHFSKQKLGFHFNLATGDSLLHGPRSGDKGARERYLFEDPLEHVYEVEDAAALKWILSGQYHVVVGNPPYITVKDKALNIAYRERFKSCHQKYSLVVPFMERLFDLAISPESGATEPSGYVGMIVANSFMKREFGKKLIEEFIPKWDLTHVIDTSGAYIPGHGTPTVILFGRHRNPVADTVRAVMGIRGEPKTPEDPRRGLVWSAIVEQIDLPDSKSEFVSVTDSDRAVFHKHPWSLGGGGAADLRMLLEIVADRRLSDFADSIGITSFTLEDDIFLLPRTAADRQSIPEIRRKTMVVGDVIRDWFIHESDVVVFPYDEDLKPIEETQDESCLRYLWLGRTVLANNKMFGGKTKVEAGLKWYEFGRLTADKLRTPLSIAFAFVATHNHFVLDRGGKVFNRSAPVIKLPPEATEDDHLALLGLLNSSTACFWMKQVFYPKGGDQIGTEGARLSKNPWEDRFEFDGTKLKRFPIAQDSPLKLARELDRLAQELQRTSPTTLFSERVPSFQEVEEARSRYQKTFSSMIALQEDLDWACYQAYGLCDEDLTFGSDPPGVGLGERPFEIQMARRIEARVLETTWFERHRSQPVMVIPERWPEDYQRLTKRRIDAILNNPNLALIEAPEFKRRWNVEHWDEQLERALREWLLDRLEEELRSHPPSLTSCAKLVEHAARDSDFCDVGEHYFLLRRSVDWGLVDHLPDLMLSESVPFLPILRYKPSGLAKREQWEKTWELQRLEDEGKHKGPIPVPPKYASKDFLDGSYWRLRGKLDVPKERFILFPHCERAADRSPVILWAGFNPLQQAQAIATYYLEMKEREGWGTGRIVFLLAGIAELAPWVKQWHNDPDPEHGERMGDYFAQFLSEEAAALGVPVSEIPAVVADLIQNGLLR